LLGYRDFITNNTGHSSHIPCGENDRRRKRRDIFAH
jgi:hypothetical protein